MNFVDKDRTTKVYIPVHPWVCRHQPHTKHPTRKPTPTRQGNKKSRVPKNPIPQAVSLTKFGWGTPPSDECFGKPQTQADKPPCRETSNTGPIPTSPPSHPHQHNAPKLKQDPHLTGQDLQGPPYTRKGSTSFSHYDCACCVARCFFSGFLKL